MLAPALLRRTALFAALLLSSQVGCVHRRVTIRTDPPGALAFLDDREIGNTPASTDVTYYGARDLRLVLPGYQTVNRQIQLSTPWYQFPPLDFVSDNLLPLQVTNRQDFNFRLTKSVVVPQRELIEHAEELRAQAGMGNSHRHRE